MRLEGTVPGTWFMFEFVGVRVRAPGAHTVRRFVVVANLVFQSCFIVLHLFAVAGQVQRPSTLQNTDTFIA